MLSPGMQKLLNAADALMRALLFVFLFGFIAIAWRQLAG